MGFVFNIVFVFILLPLMVLVCILWVFNRKAIWGRLLLLMTVGVVVLIVSVSIAQQIMKKKVLSKKDYYGSYIINRNYFSGKQANWQYNHYRFDIKENDTLYFYVTNKEKILKTYAYNISTTNSYESARLFLNSDTLAHHIIAKPPTTIRTAWNFNLIFHSAQYNNMYFKKGEWKPINEN